MTDNEINRIRDSMRICSTAGCTCKGCIYDGCGGDCYDALPRMAIKAIDELLERKSHSAITVRDILPLIDGRVILRLGPGSGIIGNSAMYLRGVLKAAVLDVEVRKIAPRRVGDDCSVILDLSTDEQGGDAK